MIEITPAQLSDVAELFTIENSVFNHADGLLSRRAFTYHIKKENLLLMCKNDGRIVGYILVFCPKNKTYARLYSLAVLSEFRKNSIANKLMCEALEMIDKKYKRMFLEVRKSNHGAISLYERFHFARVREIPEYYHDGESALKMCRDII